MPRPGFILFYEGILYGHTAYQTTKFSHQPRLHQLTLKRISHAEDVCSLFPISQKKIRQILSSQTTTQRQTIIARSLGLQLLDDGKFYRLDYTLSHTLCFGYFISPESFIQILKLSFNINPPQQTLPKKEGDKLAIAAVDFLLDHIESYSADIIDGKLAQHSDLISVSAENRLMWLSMLLEQFCFIANGGRV